MLDVAVRQTSHPIFWTRRYWTTPWSLPTSIFQVYFITPTLVGKEWGEQQHHLYELLPFGFKSTFILNSAIVWSDNHMSHNSSTSYSYWSSLLNQTTHIAWLPNHFLYSVTLDTKGLVISRLSTRAPFRKPQPTSIKMSHFILLSQFISWTIDRPISFYKYDVCLYSPKVQLTVLS
jgi:hypothetical protein